jgi:N6-adenosine-specific RNA methylase IME4
VYLLLSFFLLLIVIAEPMDNLSTSHFGTVYADPPWLYGNQGTRAATSNHYAGLSVEQLCQLPVDRLTLPDAHLHLWTTNAFLFDARSVMEAWGFTYKSCFVWVKTQMGIGNYWRVSHEFMLLGTRGKAPFNARNLKSWAEFPRTRHSAKPHQIREMIEAASPGPYLELFARQQVAGWTAWGDQISEDLFSGGE